MTKDETLQLAVEAGLWDINDATEGGGLAELFELLERFAALVAARAAAAERAECAVVADKGFKHSEHGFQIAQDIRARSES